MFTISTVKNLCMYLFIYFFIKIYLTFKNLIIVNLIKCNTLFYRDYCCSKEMQEILSDMDLFSNNVDSEHDLNCTLNQSLCNSNLIVYLSNLNETSRKLFQKAISKHKIKLVPVYKYV